MHCVSTPRCRPGAEGAAKRLLDDPRFAVRARDFARRYGDLRQERIIADRCVRIPCQPSRRRGQVIRHGAKPSAGNMLDLGLELVLRKWLHDVSRDA
jgi:hypothetical protein